MFTENLSYEYASLSRIGAPSSSIRGACAGFYPPTSGTAIVNGYDVRTDIDRVRRSLGICPQNTVLFDTLSVEEHVQFFARVRHHRIDTVANSPALGRRSRFANNVLYFLLLSILSSNYIFF